jgi:hypothetical protein
MPHPVDAEKEFLDISFDKRLESYASCYSQPYYSGGFLKKTRLYSGFKTTNKKSAKQEISSLFVNSIL